MPTITGITIPWQGTDPVYIRIGRTQPSTDASGVFIPAGDESYPVIGPITPSSGTLVIPNITLPPTEDALDNPHVAAIVGIYDAAGVRHALLFTGRVPATPSTQTWTQLEQYQQPLPKITAFDGVGATRSTVNLSWQCDVDPASFEAQKSSDGITWAALSTPAGSARIGGDATGMEAGEDRQYRIRAVGVLGKKGPWAGPVRARSLDLDAVSLLATILGLDQVRLQWIPDLTVDGYKIERAIEGGSYLEVGSVGVVGIYTATMIPPHLHRFKVRAFTGSHFGPYSDEVYVQAPDLYAPINFAATPLNLTTNRLTWTDNNQYETGFAIARSLKGANIWAVILTPAANAVTADDTTAVAGVEYDYRIQATATAKNSSFAYASCTTYDVNVPAAFSAVKNGANVDITFTDNNLFETGVEIWARTDGGSSSLLTTLAADTTTYSYTPTPGHIYNYKARAISTTKNSGYTAEQAVTMPLAAPASITVTDISETAIDVTVATVTGATSYKIERADNGAPFVEVATGVTVFPWHDTGRTPGGSYSYRGRGSSSAMDSPYSPTGTVVTPLPAPPAAPSGLTVTAISGSQLNLAWTDNSGNESGFRIERSANGTTGWTEIAVVGAGVTSYPNTGLALTTPYYYRVRAYNGFGNSAYTTVANGTTLSTVALADVADLLHISADQLSLTDGAAVGSGAITDTSPAARAVTCNSMTFKTNVQNSKPALRASGSSGSYVGFDQITTMRWGIAVVRYNTMVDNRCLFGDLSVYHFAGGEGQLLIDPGNAHANVKDGTIKVNGYVDGYADILKPGTPRIVSFLTTGNVSLATIFNDRNAYFTNADILEVGISSTPPDSTTEGAVIDGLKAKYNLTSDTAPLRREVIALGDSQSAGGGWQTYLVNRLAGLPDAAGPVITGPWFYTTYATSGYTIQDWIDQTVYTSGIASRRDVHRTAQVCVIFLGGNDLNTQTAATAYTRLTNLISLLQTDGYTDIIFVGVPPRTAGAGGGSVPSDFNTKRHTLNANVAANAASLGIGYVDIEADHLIGDDGDSDDTIYYSDQIHLTNSQPGGLKQLAADIAPLMPA